MQKTITKIDTLPQLDKKLRVAAYARVSSGKDAMLHSLSAQITYYQSKITSHNGWLYAGVYADEALTGTKDNRAEFQRMIQDCKDGKIDLIIVKSISRFARNTATMLEIVRMLKSINVDVYFEEQNLHSMSAEGEMVLTFLASFAQEESRSVSENMKWRIKHSFEEGIAWGTKGHIGYRIVDKKFVVVPEEAAIVRRIYKLYIEGIGYQRIADIINEEGYRTVNGGLFQKTTVDSILRNYNYTGDLVLQKTFRTDHLTKHKKVNRGEMAQYIVEDDHEPIVSKEEFMLVQELKLQRATHFRSKRTPNETYPFTGLIRCGICGKNYRRKKGTARFIWTCATFNVHGKDKCNSKSIPEETLTEIAKVVLGVKKLTVEVARKHIDYIEAFNGNKVVFHLKNGNIVESTWRELTRRDSWTPEKREAARQRTLQQHQAKDGTNNG